MWFFLTDFTDTGGAPYPGGAEGASDDLGATTPPRAVIERKGRQKREAGGGGRRGGERRERGGNERGSERYRERRSEKKGAHARDALAFWFSGV